MTASEDEAPSAWASEIRDYLLGRLSSRERIGRLNRPESDTLRDAPVRQWWTLEGRQYVTLGGSLASNIDIAVRLAKRLDATFNPRLRLTERPEADVDWPETLARGPRTHREFVVRSSGLGLNEAEREALHGWTTWIQREWSEYFQGAPPTPSFWPLSRATRRDAPSIEQLRRYALTTRRSRWPLLREVIAESLRPLFEMSDIDRLPLPTSRFDLFELLCLVRVAKSLAEPTRAIKWINRETNSNTISWGNLTCYYQHRIRREDIVGASDFSGSVGRALNEFAVRLPERLDLVFEFKEPLNGFEGFIIEAKSGDQGYDATVEQLRAYRAGWSRTAGRFVVWGIVERAPDAVTAEQIRRLHQRCGTDEDLWLFSSVDDIPLILSTLFADVAVTGI